MNLCVLRTTNNGHAGEAFVTSRGITQGCPISSLLFGLNIVYLQRKWIRHLHIHTHFGLLGLIDQNKMLIPTSTPMMVMMICWYWAQTKGEHEYMPERINEFYSHVVDMMLDKLPDKPSDDDKVGACTQILYSILKYGLNGFYN